MLLQIFNKDGSIKNNFVKILNSDFSFSNNLGSGQTSLRLDLDYKEMDLLGKFIKFFINETLIFSGQIITENYNLVGKTEIVVYGLYDIFNSFDVIGKFDTYGACINYLVTKVKERFPFFDGEMFIDNSYMNYGKEFKFPYIGTSIIQDIVKDSDFDFFIGADGKIKFGKNISTKHHYISLGKEGEIISGKIGRTLRGYISKVKGISSTFSTGYVENTEDIEKFGIYSKTILFPSADNTKLMKKTSEAIQTPLASTEVEVKGNIWKYEVGDYVTIENCIFTAEKVKIIKIDFYKDKAKLYLDNYSNASRNIKSEINRMKDEFINQISG